MIDLKNHHLNLALEGLIEKVKEVAGLLTYGSSSCCTFSADYLCGGWFSSAFVTEYSSGAVPDSHGLPFTKSNYQRMLLK